MKRKLPALLLFGELLLITIMHIVKYNQQASINNKERNIVVSEQNEVTPTLQLNQHVVYKLAR